MLLKKPLFHRISLLGIFFLLAACSTLQQPTFNPESSAYLKAQGKLAISYQDKKQTTHSESGRFNWQQEHQHFNWYIAGPFGLGWVNIAGNKQRVTLTTQNGTIDNAATAERLLQKHNLPNLPLSDLNWWIKGRPNPNKPVRFIQTNNSPLQSFTQSTATISYLEVFDADNHRQKILPKKILITLPQGKMKLFISRWQQGGNP